MRSEGVLGHTMTLAVMVVALFPLAPTAPGAYEAVVLKWRAEREARLKADGGWLTVAGLHWLKDGTSSFGTDPGADIVLPPDSAPARAGVFEHRGGKTTVRLEPGVVATVEGRPASTQEMAPDTSGAPVVLSLGRLTLHVIERGGRFAVRLKDLDSPRRREFPGLEWFPVRESYRVVARFVPYDPARRAEIPDVTGGVQQMTSPGYVVFRVAGREVRLDALLEEPDAEQLFFIFRDETSGGETYAAGRFLYADRPADGRVVLDFNRAYSPPCAFTPFATCPLPPRQNRLAVRIEAGERSSVRH